MFQTALAIVLITIISRQNPCDHRSVLFQRLLYTGLLWAGFDLIMEINRLFLPSDTGFRLYGLLSFMFLFFPAVAMQLSLSLIRDLSRREKNMILAPFFLLYLVILIFPELSTARTFGIPGGYEGRIAPWNLAFKLLGVGASLGCVGLLILRSQNETDAMVRKEKQLLALGAFLFICGIMVSQGVKHVNPGLPWFANLATCLFSFSAFVSLKKYGRVLSGQTLFETLVKISPSGIAHIRGMEMIWANTSMMGLLKTDKDHMDDIRGIFHVDQPLGISRDAIISGIAQGKLDSRVVYVKNKSEDSHACLINCAPLEKNRPENGVLMILTDVSEEDRIRKKLFSLNQTLEKMAHMDGLTNLANRRQFDRVLDREWQRTKRSGRPLSLVILDVDCFKRYNDLYGHPAGDDCLKRVAQEIRSPLNRPGDLACRYGGEEFGLILPETEGEGALKLSEQIRSRVQDLGITHEDSFAAGVVTLSAGVACITDFPGMTPEDLVRRADKALYLAKKGGRNRTEVFKFRV